MFADSFEFIDLVLAATGFWFVGAVPLVMAAFSFRLWTATRLNGSLHLTLGFGLVGLVGLASSAVAAEIRHVVMNDGAEFPDWFDLFGRVSMMLVFVGQAVALVGMWKLTSALLSARPKQDTNSPNRTAI